MRFAPTSTDPLRLHTIAADEPTNQPTRPGPSAYTPPAAIIHQRRRFRPARAAIGAVVAVLAVTGTGCSSGTTPSTTTSSTTTSSTATSAPASAAGSSSSANDSAGKGQICAARDQLKTSVTALTNASLLAAGTTAIKAQVDQVQSDLAAVKKAGKQDYETEVDAMQSAVDQLQTAAGNLGNGNAAQNLQAVGTAIAATGSAADDLFTKLQAGCGS